MTNLRRFGTMLLITSLLTVAPAQDVAALSAPERCSQLTSEVNRHRTDLRRLYLLCEVAGSRVYTMKHAGRIWHDLRPVMRALERAGICWTNVGEVIAWHNSWVGARKFVTMWIASDRHRRVLLARRYDRGGGYFSASNGYEVAVYYVLDTC